MDIFSKNIVYAIGIITPLIGILAYFQLSRKKIRDKARAEFHDAFKEFLGIIETIIETGFEYNQGRIDIPFPDHIAAAVIFRRYLGWLRRKNFDRKLAKYKIAAEKYNDEAQHLGVKNVSHEMTSELKKCINSLLKYAKPK